VTSTAVGRVISVLLDFFGILFTVVVVAAAVEAVWRAVEEMQSQNKQNQDVSSGT
jgi:hypothetical protein